ncbi:hypothetical protein DFH09DRAFT_287412 [Mycena vulgaris]|nr:hypothetical protein DFH09DRAFT_287412 [Mycena vulgaris]
MPTLWRLCAAVAWAVTFGLNPIRIDGAHFGTTLHHRSSTTPTPTPRPPSPQLLPPAPFPGATPKDSRSIHTHPRSSRLATHPHPGETRAVHPSSHPAPSDIHRWPRLGDTAE